MGNMAGEPLARMTVYNPALLKKEALIAQFIARRSLLDHLVGELRRGGKTGYQHHMIIGPRGSGKTTLLRRLRYAIEDDPELYSHWLPLVFPEEQYNISRLSDLWVNCLDALSDTLERGNRKDESESLDQRIDELPADDEKRRAQAALDLLVGWAKKEGRGLVLLFDNSDLLFDRLKSDHWLIREVLSADNRLLFIGVTNAPIKATYDHEGAFFDFFKTHEMRGLTDQETREVIFNLARLRHTPHVIETLEREPGRIRALNLLTGGNLRTIVVLYQALARGKDDSIRADLEQLLDQYTPLYKHRFESLSAQSQQVVDALALNWDPATAAELAEKLRMETNAVSAVLNRLDNDGIVEKVPSPPGEKMFFQIAERFFNIWYLMRASRRVRRKLIWLVEFLKMFYGDKELYRRARHMVREPQLEGDKSQRAELALTLAMVIEEPGLRRALETEGVGSLMSCGIEDRQRLGLILDLEGEDASLKDLVERFQSLREFSEKIEQTKGELPPEFWEYLITAPTLSLEEKKKAFDEVARLGSDEIRQWVEKFESEAKRLVELFGPEPCRKLFEAIRSGQMADGADVEGADAAAIKGNDASLRVIARLFSFDRTKDEALLYQAEGVLNAVQSPHVWLSWAETVANSEDLSKKLAGALTRVNRLKGHDAGSWRRVGALQFRLRRHPEAEASYRKSIALDPDAFTSWNDLGYCLVYWKGSFDEAESAYRKAIALDPKAASPWFRLGDLLQRHLNRFEEAAAAFRKATELAPDVVLPWGFLVQLLTHHLNRYEEAEAVCREALKHRPDVPDLWMSLGFLLMDHLQKYEEAEAAFRKAIELKPNDAWLWIHLARLFSTRLGRGDDALDACRTAIELSPNDADVWMFFGERLLNLRRYEEAEAAFRKVHALKPNRQNVWGNIGLSLRLSERYEEAEAAYRKAIELEPNAPWHWSGLGQLLADHLKRYEEAEAAFRKAIELNPNETWAWLSLSELLQNHLNRSEEAVAACRKAIELAPNEAHVWYSLSHWLANCLNRYEEAEAAFRKAIELTENIAELAGLWGGLAQLLTDHLKRYEEAEAACRKAIDLDPNRSRLWDNLVGVLCNLKRYDEAEAACHRAIELDPNESRSWHNLGRILHMGLKRNEEAETAYRKAIELDPNAPWVWVSLGRLLAEPLKRYEEAEAAYLEAGAAFRKYLERNPDDAETWLHLGTIFDNNLRRPDEAEESFRKAVELKPNNIDFNRALACILIKRGKWDDSVVCARKFISEGGDEFHERNWPDIIGFFRDAVASGHAEDAVGLLDETDYGERWRPLREALQAIAEDDASYLLRVAPEIRQPAEEIVAMLAPEGSRLGGAPKSTRARRTRRKKSPD
ncbi:MAG TPA: tetratricopeptide repeat protein [Blastocatellia bacterium]|nr:tetratricopeptide repeat protein [Blastocatellia bacterium]